MAYLQITWTLTTWDSGSFFEIKILFEKEIDYHQSNEIVSFVSWVVKSSMQKRRFVSKNICIIEARLQAVTDFSRWRLEIIELNFQRLSHDKRSRCHLHAPCSSGSLPRPSPAIPFSLKQSRLRRPAETHSPLHSVKDFCRTSNLIFQQTAYTAASHIACSSATREHLILCDVRALESVRVLFILL